MKNKDRVMLFTESLEVAERSENENLHLRMLLCDFGVNANGVQLNRATVDTWIGTMINAPIVGKIARNPITNEYDFTAHNVSTVIDDKGNRKVHFDTEAFGTITGAEIIADEAGHEAIYINADIFARFENVISLILSRVENQDVINSSWELSVLKSHKSGAVKVVDEAALIGHTLLGHGVLPAYKDSQILSVACDESVDAELERAIAEDVAATNNMKVGETMNDDFEVNISEEQPSPEEEVIEIPVIESTEQEKPEEEPAAEEPAAEGDDEAAKCDDDDKKCKGEAEVSALTVNDLYCRLNDAIRSKIDKWAWVWQIFPSDAICWANYEGAPTELDFVQFTYTVTNETVAVGEPEYITLVASPREMSAKITEMSDALVKANDKLQSLEAEIATLGEYRDAYEKAQHDEKVAEISAYALKSGRISADELNEDGAVKTMVSELNLDGIKMLISDRLIESMKESAVETSTVKTPRVNARIEDDVPAKASKMVSAWLAATNK